MRALSPLRPLTAPAGALLAFLPLYLLEAPYEAVLAVAAGAAVVFAFAFAFSRARRTGPRTEGVDLDPLGWDLALGIVAGATAALALGTPQAQFVREEEPLLVALVLAGCAALVLIAVVARARGSVRRGAAMIALGTQVGLLGSLLVLAITARDTTPLFNGIGVRIDDIAATASPSVGVFTRYRGCGEDVEAWLVIGGTTGFWRANPDLGTDAPATLGVSVAGRARPAGRPWLDPNPQVLPYPTFVLSRAASAPPRRPQAPVTAVASDGEVTTFEVSVTGWQHRPLVVPLRVEGWTRQLDLGTCELRLPYAAGESTVSDAYGTTDLDPCEGEGRVDPTRRLFVPYYCTDTRFVPVAYRPDWETEIASHMLDPGSASADYGGAAPQPTNFVEGEATWTCAPVRLADATRGPRAPGAPTVTLDREYLTAPESSCDVSVALEEGSALRSRDFLLVVVGALIGVALGLMVEGVILRREDSL